MGQPQLPEGQSVTMDLLKVAPRHCRSAARSSAGDKSPATLLQVPVTMHRTTPKARSWVLCNVRHSWGLVLAEDLHEGRNNADRGIDLEATMMH